MSAWARLRQRLGSVTFAGLSAAASLGSAGEARADEGAQVTPLQVLNYSGYFSTASIEADFRKAGNEELFKTLQRDRRAVLVLQGHILLGNGRNYCAAFVGISEAPPKGRMARLPAVLFNGMGRSNLRGQLTDDQLNGCMGAALDVAIANFVRESPEGRLADVEKTKEKGTRKGEPPLRRAFRRVHPGVRLPPTGLDSDLSRGNLR